MKFKVGDKVVHPAHGAGFIAAIEEKDVLDEFNRYYVINLAVQDLKVMVPVRTADEIGLRSVATQKVSRSIFKILAGAPEDLPDDFKKRQADIIGRLREGDAESLAFVVRDMAARSRKKTYSPTEARLFEQARTMLSGEIALSLNAEVEKTLERIDVAGQKAADEAAAVEEAAAAKEAAAAEKVAAKEKAAAAKEAAAAEKAAASKDSDS